MRTDGRTDRQTEKVKKQGDIAKLIVAFRSYAIEKYGAKGIILFKSVISTAE